MNLKTFQSYPRIGVNPEFQKPLNGGSLPPRGNHWNDLFAASFGNKPLEGNFTDHCSCGDRSGVVGVACPNCEKIVE